MNDDDDPLNMLEAIGIVAIALSTAVWVWLLVCTVFYFI